ncbi:MAG TPA: NAD(P)/FAD-dependent oxidoreductase [Thermoanaerobaculia bacterium]|nr:NAD(P)/FAD-dependent oxidoreductase [Thermoanaerobaculia bacterium]
MEKVLVIGAGLVGSVAASFMADLGFEVDLCDRQGDPRVGPTPGGRSINLTICARGFAALDRIGAGDDVRSIGIPCHGRIIHGVDGSLEVQPYGTRGEAIWSVSRNELNLVLLEHAARRETVRTHFDERCLEVDLETPAATFEGPGGFVRRTADRLLATDGARSAVRLKLQQTRRFDYQQEFVDQGYRELRAPALPDGGWPIAPNAIHIWPRGNYMLIGFPNRDGSFTLSIHLPFLGEPSFDSIRTPEALLAFFRSSFPDALPLLPTLVDDFFARSETTMITVRCFPWVEEDRAALVGDAAHAIVPSYGQGANCGFEDCSVLYDCVRASEGDWRTAFAEYQRLRKENADAIADLALEHFLELRHLVGTPEFLLRKEVERWLEDRHPDRYQPLYSLVSFTNVPYVEALRRDREQRGLVDRLLAVPNVRERLGGAEVRSLVESFLELPSGAAHRTALVPERRA